MACGLNSDSAYAIATSIFGLTRACSPYITKSRAHSDALAESTCLRVSIRASVSLRNSRLRCESVGANTTTGAIAIGGATNRGAAFAIITPQPRSNIGYVTGCARRNARLMTLGRGPGFHASAEKGRTDIGPQTTVITNRR